MVPKNALKCLLFTVLTKPFKSLGIMGVRRCKRKRTWMIKFLKEKTEMRGGDGEEES